MWTSVSFSPKDGTYDSEYLTEAETTLALYSSGFYRMTLQNRSSP